MGENRLAVLFSLLVLGLCDSVGLNSIDNKQEDAKIIISGDFNMLSIQWIELTGGIEPFNNDSNEIIDALLDTMTYTSLNQFNNVVDLHNGILDFFVCCRSVVEYRMSA